ncbi:MULTISPECIES: FadR/GntR family transcriptional regulator [Achromobacter]|jgi:DNA-binding FadR family transcriptional regulator|uniref:FadR/GntR family transcriptional regulator n=1 Tax=Achromobacter TaxID=222 RepID=UPI000CFD4F56|nr:MULTISPECIES: FadR/GntR family transcriptional regulator [Achromobacter]MDR6599479.1 DNA-binding FadR family transcriptional regulator [Achromobacter deleyi]PQZ68837.1 GntR family transcriptional regulator [Achromobacter sp. MYb9]HCW16391.1 FadR family transcriptional regulator [Achromobacter sp.]
MQTPARPRPRSRLTDVVIEELTKRLDTRLYRAGDKLPSEHQLCDEFDVSRTVVREAVASMRLSGRLVSKPGIGVFVTEDREKPIDFVIEPAADPRWALHIMELRAGLEVEACGLAAERRTAADLSGIVEAFDAFNRATRDMEAAVKADYEFHLSIAKASNNPHFPALLKAAVRDVMLDLNIKHGGKTPQELETYETRNVREHEAILTAIMRRDPGAARAAMARHLGDSIARYRKLLSQAPAQ